MDSEKSRERVYILYSCDVWKTRPMYVKLASVHFQKLVDSIRNLIADREMEFLGCKNQKRGGNLLNEWLRDHIADMTQPTAYDISCFNTDLQYGFLETW